MLLLMKRKNLMQFSLGTCCLGSFASYRFYSAFTFCLNVLTLIFNCCHRGSLKGNWLCMVVHQQPLVQNLVNVMRSTSKMMELMSQLHQFLVILLSYLEENYACITSHSCLVESHTWLSAFPTYSSKECPC